MAAKAKTPIKKEKSEGKYAVIRLKGQQFRVRQGDEILVGKLGEKEKAEAEVLMVGNGKDSKVGRPTVKGAKVALKILELAEKGEKLHVKKYKAKSRYRKHIGFRPVYTRLQVGKIS